MIGPMQPDEALAVARLRQWCYDRLSLTSARTCDYQRQGWQQRNDRAFDARLVRVIDFGRASHRSTPKSKPPSCSLTVTKPDTGPRRKPSNAPSANSPTSCPWPAASSPTNSKGSPPLMAAGFSRHESGSACGLTLPGCRRTRLVKRNKVHGRRSGPLLTRRSGAPCAAAARINESPARP